jgi:ribosomal protein S8
MRETGCNANLNQLKTQVMIVSQSKVEEFIQHWQKATKKELKNRLTTLKTKSKTVAVLAEIKAITALLA